MEKFKVKDIDSFIKKYGMSPTELENELINNKITRTAFARKRGFPRTTVLRHFEAFNVKGYIVPKKESKTYTCTLCGNTFDRYVSPSKEKAKKQLHIVV